MSGAVSAEGPFCLGGTSGGKHLPTDGMGEADFRFCYWPGDTKPPELDLGPTISGFRLDLDWGPPISVGGRIGLVGETDFVEGPS